MKCVGNDDDGGDGAMSVKAWKFGRKWKEKKFRVWMLRWGSSILLVEVKVGFLGRGSGRKNGGKAIVFATKFW